MFFWSGKSQDHFKALISSETRPQVEGGNKCLKAFAQQFLPYWIPLARVVIEATIETHIK
jgi:hypothetical protein